MLKNICNIETNATVIKYSQTVVGKIFLILIFSLLICAVDTYPNDWKKFIVLTITGITFVPKYRYIWLFIGMMSLLIQNTVFLGEPDWVFFQLTYWFWIFNNNIHSYFSLPTLKFISIFLMVLINEITISLMRYPNRNRIMNYPIVISYILLISLLLIANYIPFSKLALLILWAFIIIYNHYFWFAAYTTLESKLENQRNFILDYARFMPIWGFTLLPYGKGSLYLQRTEAQTPLDFTVTQLKAIKLAWWAFILYFVLHGLFKLEAYYHLPKLTDALADYSAGKHYPPAKVLLFLIDKFFRNLLAITVFGHFVVAICRMCGFRILRNTYKPLQSRTIAEYWNRYNYYFKELLVDFFFYPTYFNFFKNSPRIRLFVATIAAATIGNILFHFQLLIPTIMSYGLIVAIKGFIPFMFYTVVLGVAIALSQLRNLSPRDPGHNVTKIFSSISVVVFYALLGLFNLPYQTQSIMINFKILASLFNITW